jgi:hypothetical protein
MLMAMLITITSMTILLTMHGAGGLLVVEVSARAAHPPTPCHEGHQAVASHPRALMALLRWTWHDRYVESQSSPDTDPLVFWTNG